MLNESNDGFEIARMDLEMRGPGAFFGIRQSGELDFKLGDIYQDAGILELAHKHLQKCKEERFDFSAYPELSWDTGQMLSI